MEKKYKTLASSPIAIGLVPYIRRPFTIDVVCKKSGIVDYSCAYLTVLSAIILLGVTVQ